MFHPRGPTAKLYFARREAIEQAISGEICPGECGALQSAKNFR